VTLLDVTYFSHVVRDQISKLSLKKTPASVVESFPLMIQQTTQNVHDGVPPRFNVATPPFLNHD
jgi:hypothetical protein